MVLAVNAGGSCCDKLLKTEASRYLFAMLGDHNTTAKLVFMAAIQTGRVSIRILHLLGQGEVASLLAIISRTFCEA